MTDSEYLYCESRYDELKMALYKKLKTVRDEKVSGWILVRALDCYDFEFYVDDDATDAEIEKMVDDTIEMSLL